MSKPKLITRSWLTRRRACAEQVAIFVTEWPKGVEITEVNIDRAEALKLDLDWFAKHILTAPARKAYEEATAPARKAYEEATAPALKAYEEARAPALIEALRRDGLL